MTRVCPNCGAVLLTRAANCSFCEIPGEVRVDSPRVRRTSPAATEDLRAEWRANTPNAGDPREGRHQLHEQQTAQPALPFRPRKNAQHIVREHPRPRSPQRERTERLEICIQPQLDFASSVDRARPLTALIPIASLSQRGRAGALDALFILLTTAGFLALFRYIGGRIGFGKVDILVFATIIYLFYALYFFIFNTLAGITPGMQLCGLSCVRLDGSLPDTAQLLWRGFGYLLSGTAMSFGFLWSLWDEDSFTWQDRISQTYLTAASPLADSSYP